MVVENGPIAEFYAQGEIRLLLFTAMEFVGVGQYSTAKSMLADAIVALQRLEANHVKAKTA